MKKVLLALSMLLMLTACNNTGKTGGDSLGDDNVECDEFNPHSFLMTQDKLSDKIDFDMDFSDMTYQELRLLKSYVYATKGVWFMEAEVNTFFSTKCDWYFDRCFEYCAVPTLITDMTKDVKEIVDEYGVQGHLIGFDMAQLAANENAAVVADIDKGKLTVDILRQIENKEISIKQAKKTYGLSDATVDAIKEGTLNSGNFAGVKNGTVKVMSKDNITLHYQTSYFTSLGHYVYKTVYVLSGSIEELEPPPAELPLPLPVELEHAASIPTIVTTISGKTSFLINFVNLIKSPLEINSYLHFF